MSSNAALTYILMEPITSLAYINVSSLFQMCYGRIILWHAPAVQMNYCSPQRQWSHVTGGSVQVQVAQCVRIVL